MKVRADGIILRQWIVSVTQQCTLEVVIYLYSYAVDFLPSVVMG